MGSTEPFLPYWQVNVPESERTAECPEFLFNLKEKDIRILSTPDSEYQVDSWEVVKQKVAGNRLELFQRIPSELRRYRLFTWQLARDYGSIMEFILTHRLQWGKPFRSLGTKPFEQPEDVKILWNDWPYGLDERIVHLVVWTRFELAEDPASGDLTDQARAEIEAYVQRTFSPRIPRDNYIWFKNWASLKSVHAVEHFHVMLFDPDPAFISEITNGDVPLSQKLRS